MITGILIILYTTVLVVVSVSFTKKNANERNFLLAGRSMPWFLVSAIILGDVVGGASVMGVGQTAYNFGIGAFSFNIAVSTGLILLGLTIAPLFRRLENSTICETMGVMFNLPVRKLTALILLLVYFIVTCVQFSAGGAILSELMPISRVTGVVITGVVSVTVVVLGGLKGLGLLNIINVVFICIGLLSGVLYSLDIVGGWESLWDAVPEGYAHFSHYGANNIVAVFFTTVFTCFVTQAALMGIYGAKSPRDAKIGSLAAGLLMLPIGFMATIIGVSSRAHFGDSIPNGLGALPQMAAQLPPVISAVMFLGLWALILSTSAPCLLAITQVLHKDMFDLLLPKHIAVRLVKRVRLTTLIFGTVITIASFTIMQLLQTLVFTFTLRTAMSISLLLAVMVGNRYRWIASPKAVFWAMLTGFMTTIIWVPILHNPWEIHEFYPSTLVFLVVMCTIGLVKPRLKPISSIS